MRRWRHRLTNHRDIGQIADCRPFLPNKNTLNEGEFAAPGGRTNPVRTGSAISLYVLPRTATHCL